MHGISGNDNLWTVIEPHLPLQKPDVGRPRTDPRAMFGILYVLTLGLYLARLTGEIRHEIDGTSLSSLSCRTWHLSGHFPRSSPACRIGT